MSAGSDTLFRPAAAFTACEIAAATNGRWSDGHPPGGPFSVRTDSRTAEPGTIFVALAGERFDGHDFLGSVASQGAVALVRRGRALPGMACIEVDDPLVALGDLARAHLLRFGTPVAGVTGSVGKTTTRSLLASILGAAYGVGLESEGNYNNRIGVPLTVLALEGRHRFAVLEMGMSEPGEIRALAAITRPRVRVITRIAPAHLQFFPDTDAIARAKGELFEAAVPGDHLVLNADQHEHTIFPRPRGTIIHRASLTPRGGDVWVDHVEDRGLDGGSADLCLERGTVAVDLPLAGRHQWMNALLAAAAAEALGADAEAIRLGLRQVRVPGRRMKSSVHAGVTWLDDAYNANPASVDAGLRTLAALAVPGRRWALLGDMLELGPTGPALHRQVGTLAADLGLHGLVAVGPLMAEAADEARKRGIEAHSFATAAEAGLQLRALLREGDTVLVKGSRGMRMEGAIDAALGQGG